MKSYIREALELTWGGRPVNGGDAVDHVTVYSRLHILGLLSPSQ